MLFGYILELFAYKNSHQNLFSKAKRSQIFPKIKYSSKLTIRNYLKICKTYLERKNLKSGSGGIRTRTSNLTDFYSIKKFEDTNFYFITNMSPVF